ncbi:MAG: peptidyl-prolyl cis-trans isomerase [Neisseriaceae bacterium]|nr:peptidyl-prolyl cis-trans isomerase [Neisseriaceae bacterium]
MKKSIALLFLLTSGFIAIAAEAPQIEDARIDPIIEQFEAQSHSKDKMPAEQREEMRKQLKLNLQRSEVLKNEAIKAGLDKDENVKNMFKNVESEFYANQYVEYLKKNIKPSDNDLHKLYERVGREVRLQTAVFRTKQEAGEALQKLNKGMSFTDLVKSLPEQPPVPDTFVSTQMFPPELATVIDKMNKGKISDEPVEFQGIFYLFKVADTRKSQAMPDFNELKPNLTNQYVNEKSFEQIQLLFKEYGLE